MNDFQIAFSRPVSILFYRTDVNLMIYFLIRVSLKQIVQSLIGISCDSMV